MLFIEFYDNDCKQFDVVCQILKVRIVFVNGALSSLSFALTSSSTLSSLWIPKKKSNEKSALMMTKKYPFKKVVFSQRWA